MSYIRTPEIRAKISAACKGRQAPNKGKKMSEEQRLRMIAFQKGKHWSPSTEFKNGCKTRFKEGRAIIGGYMHIYSPNHPYKKVKHYVLEHRLVFEKHLGRYLLPTEIIHHINSNKLDNRIENLMYFPNASAHSKYHQVLIRNISEPCSGLERREPSHAANQGRC